MHSLLLYQSNQYKYPSYPQAASQSTSIPIEPLHNHSLNQLLPTLAMSSDKPTIFLNTTAANPSASAAFYTALGFISLPTWSDDSSKSFTLPSPNQRVCVMVHSHDRFKEFIRPGSSISDAHRVTETLFSVAVDTREEVDEWLNKAVEAGGQKDPYVMEGFGKSCGMYTRSFADLDGHIWEVLYNLPEGQQDSK